MQSNREVNPVGVSSDLLPLMMMMMMMMLNGHLLHVPAVAELLADMPLFFYTCVEMFCAFTPLEKPSESECVKRLTTLRRISLFPRTHMASLPCTPGS